MNTLRILRVVMLSGLVMLGSLAVLEASQAEFDYLVLEIDEHGCAEAVYHRRYMSTRSEIGLSEAVAQATLAIAGDEQALLVRLISDNVVVFRAVVHPERQLRGEFHGRPEGPGFAIVGARHIQDRIAVTVRVPAVPGAILEIEGMQRNSFDLDAIEARSGMLRLAPVGSHVAAQTLNGDPNNRVDLLVMGDGYTSSQAAVFATDATSLITDYFAISPNMEYENYVNTYTLFTASPEAGADHPPYDPACVGDDPSCCAEYAADPLAGTYVSTAFDGRYCAWNIHRLLVVDEAKVFAAAAAVPDWDTIFVIVNDSTYGGSGGSIAVASTHPAAADVVRHEVGHSFSGLADEYDSPFPGFPTCSDISGPACEANVTDADTRPLVKWEPWIATTTPVPTPEGSGYYNVVGLFEGARYQTSGMYRPREWCLMRSLGVPFCEVCAQSYVLKLYDGGWGDPFFGIDMIEPGSETPPPGPVETSDSIELSVTLLEPAGGPNVDLVWVVDGVVQTGQTGSSFVFNPPGSGDFHVTIEVSDLTPLVHAEMAGSSLETSRQWIVQVLGVIFADGFEEGTTDAWSTVSRSAKP